MITGVLVGRIVNVRAHPRAARIWLADVDLGDSAPPVQIVFGGKFKLAGGELVPVAPPGSRALVQRPGSDERVKKKMRVRRYRGERSHGMLCSLDELGWLHNGPDEVAVLRRLMPGQCLDDLPPWYRGKVVKGWKRALKIATKGTAAPTATESNRALPAVVAPVVIPAQLDRDAVLVAG